MVKSPVFQLVWYCKTRFLNAYVYIYKYIPLDNMKVTASIGSKGSQMLANKLAKAMRKIQPRRWAQKCRNSTVWENRYITLQLKSRCDWRRRISFIITSTVKLNVTPLYTHVAISQCLPNYLPVTTIDSYLICPWLPQTSVSTSKHKYKILTIYYSQLWGGTSPISCIHINQIYTDMLKYYAGARRKH